MSITQFIVSFTAVAAWPTVLLVIAVMFRSELTALLKRISALKHKDTELQFGRELAKAAEEVKRESTSRDFLEGPEAKRVASIFDIDPKAAFIAAWVDFEGVARGLASRDFPEEQKVPLPITQLISLFYTKRIITPSDANFLRVWNKIRNAILHDPSWQLDGDVAYEGVKALLILTAQLRGR